MSGGLLPEELSWATGQLERGEGTGYLHYQLVVAFRTKVSRAGVKRLFGSTAHCELSRSEYADAYCNKEETRAGPPFTLGAKPIRVNSKVDYEAVWISARNGNVDAIPARVRVVSYRTIRTIAADYAETVAVPDRSIIVYWGPTATGKSYRAWNEAGYDSYSKCPRSKFWCGYQSQEHVVIDEFRGGIDVAHLLRWFDRYPVRVEIKGSSKPFLVKKIWITSNLDPYNWYPELDHDSREAFLRRLKVVHMNVPLNL